LHSTQKPESLMRALVDQFTDPVETILDTFAGSGTTLVAAAYLGRKAVGIEQNEKHAETIAKRLTKAGDTLFGGVA
jgi:DNA modification methylase